MEAEVALRSTAASAGAEQMGATKGLNGTRDFGGPSAGEVTTTLKEGMSLIDRFYSGGNRAKPEALNIIVVVLDQVVRRMREQYARHKKEADELHKQCRAIDETIARIRPLQAKIKNELDEKQATCSAYEELTKKGTEVISDGVDFAREALRKAKLVTKQTQMAEARKSMQDMKGYDKSGRPLPGREVNLRKNPNGPAARKPGDMLKDLKASGRIS